MWDVDIEYEVGAARHKVFLAVDGNQVSGSHQGWAYEGDLKGQIDGNRVKFRSTLPADGNVLTYAFEGAVAGSEIKGDVHLGEYGRRHGGVRCGIARPNRCGFPFDVGTGAIEPTLRQ